MGRRCGTDEEKNIESLQIIQSRGKRYKEVYHFLETRCEKIHKLPPSPAKILFVYTAIRLKEQIQRDTGLNISEGERPADDTKLKPKAVKILKSLYTLRAKLLKA